MTSDKASATAESPISKVLELMSSLQQKVEKEGETISVEESKIDDVAKKIAVNTKDLTAATEIRKKEAGDFSVADADLAETIDMLSRAIGIIEKNMRATGFVQGNKEVVTALQALLHAASIDS